MQNRRFTRLTDGFSKKLESHIHMIGLYTAFYNFIRMHKTLRMTPAMAAGIAYTVWSMADIVALVDARRRGRDRGGLTTSALIRCDAGSPDAALA